MTLAHLTLFRATDEQILESRKRTCVQWSRGRTMEEYLERDKIMDGHVHAAQGKLVTWVLAPRDNSTTLDFMSSCETFRRIGVIAKPGDSSPQAVTCYGIASVFTPASKRGHCYASHMMRLLHWVLSPPSALPAFPEEWGLPPPEGLHDARFSVLYSDVGSVFYHNSGPIPGSTLGWATSNPFSTQWKVPGLGDANMNATGAETGEWRWLSSEDAERVWERDVQLMRQDIISTAKSTNKVAYTFLADAGVGQFNIQRVMKLGPDMEPVLPTQVWGVELTNARDIGDAFTFATWTFEPGTKTMVLTRLRASEGDFPQLLGKIFEAAKRVGKDTIETWNLPDHLANVAARLGGRTFERDEHLPASKWYGPETMSELVWSFNEKFCWC